MQCCGDLGGLAGLADLADSVMLLGYYIAIDR